jgi:sugar lactone lactonase YvrE
MHAEQVTGSVAYHGEGPVWSERWGGLRWVDMLAGDVLSLGGDGTVRRRHTSREWMAPDDDPLAGSLFRADVGVSGLPGT